MGNNSSRNEYFEEYDIDPYEVLDLYNLKNVDLKGLKKAYMKKARLIHPDKTKGSTEIEFKILQECYEYLKEEFDNTPVTTSQKDFQDLRNLHNEDPNFEVDRPSSSRGGGVDHSVFTKKRSDYMIDNLNFDDFERKVTLKSKEQRKDEEEIFKAFKGKKFDLDKFNSLFELKKAPVSKELIKAFNPEPGAASSQLEMAKVKSHNGLMITTERDDDYLKHLDDILSESIENPDKDSSELITQKQILKIKKEKAKSTGKMSKKKALEKTEQMKSENIVVNTTKTFAERERLQSKSHIKKLKEEIEENKEFIKKYGHVFGDHLLEQAHKGLLEDSSNCIKNSSQELQEPKGRRKIRF